MYYVNYSYLRQYVIIVSSAPKPTTLLTVIPSFFFIISNLCKMSHRH